MSKLKHFFAAMAALCVFLLAWRAEATHFRYGNITYTVADPVNAPTTVRFDVTVAWRKDYCGIGCNDSTSLNFGDGKVNPATVGSLIGSGSDATGNPYVVLRYTVTHKYDNPGVYTTFFSSCCRISNLINAGDQNFRIEARVDITGNGNKGNAVSAVPAFVQLQTNGVRTIAIPAVDPDGDPVACRFANTAESGMTNNPPTVPGGAVATVAPSASPPGCLITWNTAAGQAGQQYAIAVIMESAHAGTISTAVVDFIAEFVVTPPPTCAGTGDFKPDMGDTVTTALLGTNNSGGGNLLMTTIGFTGVVNPPTGTTGASPMTTNFSWTPGLGEQGTSILTVVYTDQNNSSGYCSLTFTVPDCPGYGAACSAGVGGCKNNGTVYCEGAQVLCSAQPGQPQAETCDGVDNDCNGSTDEGNPQGGAACPTGLPGVCSTGVSDCPGGVLTCIPDIPPGSQAETCNGIDDDCDGDVDNGFNIGELCNEGGGGCQSQGFFECDGMGGVECSATPGIPQPEVCNGIDDNCDMSTDEGFGVGDPCSAGVGVCEVDGAKVCDGMGGVKCDAVPGMPEPKEICGNAVDEDCDGLIDNGCADGDNDTLFDQVELEIGTNPNDADSDDDGVADNLEVDVGEDSDGDGVINGLDADSDNDGLFDGTEMGFDCGGPGTDVKTGHCVPDGDSGATKTDPVSDDTDAGGAIDGAEDVNLNGVLDADEVDPGQPGDDSGVKDSDGDSLSDAMEIALGSNPNDGDTDDDGALDGDEANPAEDTDGDGLNTLLDVDSDNDVLFDGTEMGFNCMHPDTDTGLERCRKDNDIGNTTTSPLLKDTDNGGASDGSEDVTLNGAVGSGELNPNKYEDDFTIVDTDADGLSDEIEELLDSDPSDADSDNDGVLDGLEPNPNEDRDLDGDKNVVDPDSDDDGLFDGTEMGFGCDHSGTQKDAGNCVPDADNGKTKTSPLIADQDGGGALDGDEDANHNGVVDAGERDPLLSTDDIIPTECTADADCGAVDSGRVCDDNKCIDGCRGEDGNGCPETAECSSGDGMVGVCKPKEASTTQGDTTGTPGDPGGCGCRLEASSDEDGAPEGTGLLMTALAAGLAVLRRNRRSPRARAQK